MSAVRCLTHLLQSQDPNDHYLYLACLLCVDPAVWAGTQEGRQLMLEAWEVERVMGLLESADDYIRKMVRISHSPNFYNVLKGTNLDADSYLARPHRPYYSVNVPHPHTFRPSLLFISTTRDSLGPGHFELPRSQAF